MEDIEFNIVITIVVIFVLLILTVFWFLAYCGLFTNIDVIAGQPPFKNLYVAYKFRRGPYKNAGQLFTEASSLAPDKKCFGIYYDDPQEVEPQDLKYIVGCILAEGDEEPDEILRDTMRSENFTLTTFPAITHAVLTSFPYKNSVSIFIAILRVYPQLAAFVKAKRLSAHPCIEVYDKKVVNFIMPLARQSEFYVKEVLESDKVDECTGDSNEEDVANPEVTVDETEISLSSIVKSGGSGGAKGKASGDVIPAGSADNGSNDVPSNGSTSPFEEVTADEVTEL